MTPTEIAKTTAEKIISDTCCNQSMDHRAKRDWADKMAVIIEQVITDYHSQEVKPLVEAGLEAIADFRDVARSGMTTGMGCAALRTALAPYAGDATDGDETKPTEAG